MIRNFFKGHSRTIIGIEQRTSGLILLILDPSHAPREVAALGSSHDTLRLIRRGSTAMRAPQYQIVAVKGLIETEEQYQVSEVGFNISINKIYIYLSKFTSMLDTYIKIFRLVSRFMNKYFYF